MKLKKSLGQHFLKDETVISRIIEVVKEEEPQNLLEVGPGAGALTKYLLKLPGVRLKAVELDDEKIAYLLRTYPALEGKIITGDFLEIEIPFTEEFMIVGNFPYNISSQILFKILDWNAQIPVVTGMFQDEVAKRIAAGPGSKVYGITSVLVQYYYDVEYLFEVDKACFNPPPKVQSGVIRLRRKEDLLPVKSERVLKQVVKAAFGQRRKTMRNALKGTLPTHVLADAFFEKRAETISLEDFTRLTFLVGNK